MFRFRMIASVIKTAGLGHITAVFLLIFFLCAGLIKYFDPGMVGWDAALWYCYQAVATIGFNDVGITSDFSRVVSTILSITSIFYLAVITGVVVAYCNQLIRAQKHKNVKRFVDEIDELKHLEELTPEELADLSARVREMSK